MGIATADTSSVVSSSSDGDKNHGRRHGHHYGEAPYVVAPDSAPSIPDSVWPDADPSDVRAAAERALVGESPGGKHDSRRTEDEIVVTDEARKLLRSGNSALDALLDEDED